MSGKRKNLSESEFNSLKVGDELIAFYGKGNINNRSYYFRGFVDDQVVLRTWSARNFWVYKCEDYYWINGMSITVRLEDDPSELDDELAAELEKGYPGQPPSDLDRLIK